MTVYNNVLVVCLWLVRDLRIYSKSLITFTFLRGVTMPHVSCHLFVFLLCFVTPNVLSARADQTKRADASRVLDHVDATFGSLPAPFEIKVDAEFIDALRDAVRAARLPKLVQDLDPADEDGFTNANFTTVRDFW